ncbi:MAG TPA: hypothetical protein VIX84_22295, partial [Acidimicrobiales bacterium]
MQDEAIFFKHIRSHGVRPTLSSSTHEREEQRSTHTSALPVVFDQHADIGRLAANVEIAKAYALGAYPRNVGISTIGGFQNLLSIGKAVGDAVKPTIERRWRATSEHTEQS